MQGCVTDIRLAPARRKELLLKKIPRDLNLWKRNPAKGSLRKLRKLRQLMTQFGVSETPWADRFKEVEDLLIVSKIMTV